ncbi:nucleotide binding protein [[Candida] boidinii]|nr:nucleotide binding protein [[Candida] boidinii]
MMSEKNNLNPAPILDLNNDAKINSESNIDSTTIPRLLLPTTGSSQSTSTSVLASSPKQTQLSDIPNLQNVIEVDTSYDFDSTASNCPTLINTSTDSINTNSNNNNETNSNITNINPIIMTDVPPTVLAPSINTPLPTTTITYHNHLNSQHRKNKEDTDNDNTNITSDTHNHHHNHNNNHNHNLSKKNSQSRLSDVVHKVGGYFSKSIRSSSTSSSSQESVSPRTSSRNSSTASLNKLAEALQLSSVNGLLHSYSNNNHNNPVSSRRSQTQLNRCSSRDSFNSLFHSNNTQSNQQLNTQQTPANSKKSPQLQHQQLGLEKSLYTHSLSKNGYSNSSSVSTTNSGISSPHFNNSSFSSSTLSDTSTVKETHHVHVEYDPVTGKRVLNTYEIIKDLGSGQHGKVKLARDIETNIRVAIKIVNRTSKPSLGRLMRPGSSQEDKIRREIAIMKKCNHPHVVKLIEVLDDVNSRKIYLVLEYLKKGEIKWQKTENDLLQINKNNKNGSTSIEAINNNKDTQLDQPTNVDLNEIEKIKTSESEKDQFENEPFLTLKESKQVFRDVVSGLEYLHNQGIIHRDIKPSNLLVSEDNIVKISDFGVSFAASLDGNNEFELAKTAGTPAFLAPELCKTDGSEVKVTYKIDIWALGVTLYCLLFGRLPFEAKSEFVLFDTINNEALCFPDMKKWKSSKPLSDEDFKQAKDLLCKLLEKNPEKRIDISEIKQHPFFVEGLSRIQSEKYSRNWNNKMKIEPTTEEVDEAVLGIGSRVRKKAHDTLESLRNVYRSNVPTVLSNASQCLNDKSRLKSPPLSPSASPSQNSSFIANSHLNSHSHSHSQIRFNNNTFSLTNSNSNSHSHSLLNPKHSTSNNNLVASPRMTGSLNGQLAGRNRTPSQVQLNSLLLSSSTTAASEASTNSNFPGLSKNHSFILSEVGSSPAPDSARLNPAINTLKDSPVNKGSAFLARKSVGDISAFTSLLQRSRQNSLTNSIDSSSSINSISTSTPTPSLPETTKQTVEADFSNETCDGKRNSALLELCDLVEKNGHTLNSEPVDQTETRIALDDGAELTQIRTEIPTSKTAQEMACEEQQFASSSNDISPTDSCTNTTSTTATPTASTSDYLSDEKCNSSSGTPGCSVSSNNISSNQTDRSLPNIAAVNLEECCSMENNIGSAYTYNNRLGEVDEPPYIDSVTSVNGDQSTICPNNIDTNKIPNTQSNLETYDFRTVLSQAESNKGMLPINASFASLDSYYFPNEMVDPTGNNYQYNNNNFEKRFIGLPNKSNKNSASNSPIHTRAPSAVSVPDFLKSNTEFTQDHTSNVNDLDIYSKRKQLPTNSNNNYSMLPERGRGNQAPTNFLIGSYQPRNNNNFIGHSPNDTKVNYINPNIINSNATDALTSGFRPVNPMLDTRNRRTHSFGQPIDFKNIDRNANVGNVSPISNPRGEAIGISQGFKGTPRNVQINNTNRNINSVVKTNLNAKNNLLEKKDGSRAVFCNSSDSDTSNDSDDENGPVVFAKKDRTPIVYSPPKEPLTLSVGCDDDSEVADCSTDGNLTTACNSGAENSTTSNKSFDDGINNFGIRLSNSQSGLRNCDSSNRINIDSQSSPLQGLKSKVGSNLIMSTNLISQSDGDNSSDSSEDDELTFSFSGKRSSKDNNKDITVKNKDMSDSDDNIISVESVNGGEFVDAPIDYYDTTKSASIYDVPLSLQVSRMSGALPPDDITETMDKLDINSKK